MWARTVFKTDAPYAASAPYANHAALSLDGDERQHTGVRLRQQRPRATGRRSTGTARPRWEIYENWDLFTYTALDLNAERQPRALYDINVVRNGGDQLPATRAASSPRSSTSRPTPPGAAPATTTGTTTSGSTTSSSRRVRRARPLPVPRHRHVARHHHGVLPGVLQRLRRHRRQGDRARVRRGHQLGLGGQREHDHRQRDQLVYTNIAQQNQERHLARIHRRRRPTTGASTRAA